MPSFSLVVADTLAGKTRLDKYVAASPSSMNRSKLKSGLKSLTVNGKPAKLSSKVGAGDEICFVWEDDIPGDIAPEPLPLTILYEDENVTVVNKKQGMVTHPASGNWSGTLVNALLYHWGRSAISLSPQLSPEPALQPQSGAVSPLQRPGIVHRLDKDTSGVIITARNRMAEEWLHTQFATRHKLAKIYIAVVTGVPKEKSGTIETQIVRDSADRKRFKAVTGTTAGKYACTRYQCIASYGGYSLMVLRLKTGRTHQIRVHMKYLGCPILGDPVYGRKTSGTPFSGVSLMLHAFILKICLPGESFPRTFKAPLPVRFKKVVRMLHKMGGAR